MLLRPQAVNQQPAMMPKLLLKLYSMAGAKLTCSEEGAPMVAGRPAAVVPTVP